MPNKHTKEQYRQFGAYILDRKVFSKIRFLEKDMRAIVHDSYMMNLDLMIEYAMDNHINIKDYLSELRCILLKTKNVYEKQR